MQTAHHPLDTLSIQSALHRVALSVDTLLVNGLPYGVLQPAAGEGFLQQVIDSLMADLASLDAQIGNASVAPLRANIEELTRMARDLSSFRTQPLSLARWHLERIRFVRAACVQQIQQLETRFGIPKPFDQARPAHSAAAVEAFLAQLEDALVREWDAGRAS